MKYINEFHKEWIERTRKSIEEWKSIPEHEKKCWNNKNV